MNILVIPTIRKECISEFLAAWTKRESWDEIIVVEDNPEKSFDISEDVYHYSWTEIKEELGENTWIISKRDSAIRSFGFYMAYKMGAEVIFTLDDDCYPSEENFVQKHLEALADRPRWTELVPGSRSRGIPYKNLGKTPVHLNVGLWDGIPDLDSVQALSNQDPDFVPKEQHRLIPKGQYFPMCGMNLAFKREITPLMYFPLMGLDSPYARFDDIWCGIIMKKVADHLGYNICCGHPTILHKKASNPFVNLVKEAPGIAANETFWETIDNTLLIGYHDQLACLKQIGTELQSNSDTYLQKVGKAIKIWSSLF